MWGWVRHKTKLEKLKSNYCKLIKNAYEVAIKDQIKSELLHKEAEKILKEIRSIESQT